MLLALGISLFGLLFVYAYNLNLNPSGGTASGPRVLGHSADELNVIPPGGISESEAVTLQYAITNGLLGGASVSTEFSCDGLSTNVCIMGSTSEWKACFLTEVQATSGSGAFDDGCKIVKSGSNWQMNLSQDGGEKMKCSAICIK